MIITLDTADVETARAALAEALERYGPPITLRQPGLPDLTVGCTLPELHRRMGRLLAGMYTACAREGTISPAPTGGTEQRRSSHTRGRAARGSAPAAGAGDSSPGAGSPVRSPADPGPAGLGARDSRREAAR